jgi:hypothetical protein
MPKVKYDNIVFDSQLEVDYYKYLKENAIYFVYHPKIGIETTNKNKYYPDFVVYYGDCRCEIVECKGYSQFSYLKDNMIHNIMLSKSEQELKEWLRKNSLRYDYPTKYRKIKFLKAYGFVDWDFKNPNTLANKRKEKVESLSVRLKEANKKIKDYERFMNYLLKEDKKLTKKQLEWKQNFEAIWRLTNGC